MPIRSDILPDVLDALKAALVAERSARQEAEARASGAEAMVAHLKLVIAKLRRERFGPSAERGSKLLDQLELQLEELEASATEDELRALSVYGEHVGLAFQIIDDVLDVEQSSESLGKTAGKDQAQHKITFPAVYGLERSREMAEEGRLNAHLALRPFDDRAERLRQLADFVVHRKA